MPGCSRSCRATSTSITGSALIRLSRRPRSAGQQPGTGQRGVTPQQRICPDGHILQRNTIRRDNAYFSWDIRLSKPFNFGPAGHLRGDLRGVQHHQHDNFKDPSTRGTFLDFDGTIRSGLGEPRQFQAGVRYLF